VVSGFDEFEVCHRNIRLAAATGVVIAELSLDAHDWTTPPVSAWLLGGGNLVKQAGWYPYGDADIRTRQFPRLQKGFNGIGVVVQLQPVGAGVVSIIADDLATDLYDLSGPIVWFQEKL